MERKGGSEHNFQTYQASFCFDLTVQVNNNFDPTMHVNGKLSEGNKEIKPEINKGGGRMTKKIKWEVKGGT